MKLIIKNLLAYRRRNIWLFVELILITVVTWIVLDPVMVMWGVSSRPHGYDLDRLVYMEIGIEDESSPKYSEDAADTTAMRLSFDALLNSIKGMPDVELLTPVSSWLRLESSSQMPREIRYVNEKGDTLSLFAPMYPRIANTGYFTTHGMKSEAGSPSAEELSEMSMGPNDIIVNESLAKLLFGDGGDYVGRQTVDTGDGNFYRIVGVVEDVRPWKSKGLWKVLWMDEMYTYIGRNYESTGIVVRLRDGVNPGKWVKDHRAEVYKDLHSGNLNIKYFDTYDNVASDNWIYNTATNEKNMKLGLLVFFLVNLTLGVAGTFYLQTRQRSHDVGIMKSFGATRRNVFNGLAVEALIITIAAWLIGCLIYLHYALNAGLSLGIEWSPDDLPLNHWTSDFWPHFGIVSGAVLVVLAVIVLIGVSFPARRIARVNPVDALRDE